MNGWTDYFYYFIIGATLLLSMLGLWLTAIMPGIGGWNKRFFRCFFIVIILNDFTALTHIVLLYYLAPTMAIRLISVLESLLLALPLPMLTVLLLHCCKENIRESRLFKAVSGLYIIYFLLVTSCLYNDAFFFVTQDRLAHRRALYPLILLPTILIMLLNDVATFKRRKRLSRKVYLSFFIALLPLTVTVLVQIFVDAFLLLDICMAFSALSIYSLVLSDQIEQDLRQQREISQQQASIMVLQMRPHFIYNTMTSIYCLYSQNPEKAQQVVLDFTTYLRKNFTAVASTAPIPFTSELEHTRAYLDVEQAQYPKSLIVDYDTPHTFFRVPPLTLQPIVENAVKHGRDPNAGSLHISIQTRKTDNGSEITVTDNGCGYDPADDSEPHIALKNIRQRLSLMCGGSLTITPCEDRGTVVTVMIPDSGAEKH